MPVRWTAPEGLSNLKFSTASDVWSFGITCIEIFQDAVTPYIDLTSLPAVMARVHAGQVHAQPAECSDQVYAELVRCFSFEPEARPEFRSLQAFFTRMTKPGNCIAHRDLSDPGLSRQNSSAAPGTVEGALVYTTPDAHVLADSPYGTVVNDASALHRGRNIRGSADASETMLGWTKPRDVMSIYEDVGRPNVLPSENGTPAKELSEAQGDMTSPYSCATPVSSIVKREFRTLASQDLAMPNDTHAGCGLDTANSRFGGSPTSTSTPTATNRESTESMSPSPYGDHTQITAIVDREMARVHAGTADTHRGSFGLPSPATPAHVSDPAGSTRLFTSADTGAPNRQRGLHTPVQPPQPRSLQLTDTGMGNVAEAASMCTTLDPASDVKPQVVPRRLDSYAIVGRLPSRNESFREADIMLGDASLEPPLKLEGVSLRQTSEV